MNFISSCQYYIHNVDIQLILLDTIVKLLNAILWEIKKEDLGIQKLEKRS